jgi:hypothetical protein
LSYRWLAGPRLELGLREQEAELVPPGHQDAATFLDALQ